MMKKRKLNGTIEFIEALEAAAEGLRERLPALDALPDKNTALEIKAGFNVARLLLDVATRNVDAALGKAVPQVDARDAAMACKDDLERIILALGERGVDDTLSDLKKVRNAAIYAPELVSIPSTISADDLVIEIGTAHQRVMAILINPVKVPA